MARKTKSRLELRKEAEAAEAAGGKAEAGGKKAKATRKKTTRRTKVKATQRKRLVWGVFSGSMREEARFPYDQRAAAEEKIELLRSKSKKLYFIQPIKEVITDAPVAAEKAAE